MRIRLLLLFLLFLTGFRAQGSHVSGGNIGYECLGNDRYVVRLDLFRDCGGNLDMKLVETVNARSSCGNLSFELPLRNADSDTGGTEISQLCAKDLSNSTCKGGSEPGMQRYLYADTVKLAASCDAWTIGWSSCCRNKTSNVPDSDQDEMYLEATLNTSADPCNDAPVFPADSSTFPVPYVCVDQQVNYGFGVYEPEGDSLSYALIAARTGANSTVDYGVNYSGTEPIPGIGIDKNTGELSFTPTQQGKFIVVVEVSEFDSTGTLIGKVMRDIQFVVIGSGNCSAPRDPTNASNVSGSGEQTGPFSFELCEGGDICFDVTFEDPAANDSLRIVSNHASVIPGGNFSTAGSNPATATLCWTAPPGSAGQTRTITFSAEDDNCPIPGIANAVATIRVLNGTRASPDRAICKGDSTQLYARGGSQFDWKALSGDSLSVGDNFSCNPCKAPVASPEETTRYEVTSDLDGQCVTKDTVEVTVFPDFGVDVTKSTSRTCPGDSVQLKAEPDTSGDYVYRWQPEAGLSRDSIADPIASVSEPGKASYTVEVRSGNGKGCTNRDSVTFEVLSGPGLEFAQGRPECPGDSNGWVAALPQGKGAPWDVEWIDGNGDTVRVSEDVTEDTLSGVPSGQYVIRVTSAPGCSSDTLLELDEGAQPEIDLYDDTTICKGGSATIEARGTQGNGPPYSYKWGNGFIDSSVQMVSPVQDTFYTAIAEDSLACSSSPDTVKVSVHPPLEVSAMADDTICESTTLALKNVSGGQGPPYKITWRDGSGWSQTGDSLPIQPDSTRTFYVSVQDGCETPTAVDSVRIHVRDRPSLSFTATDTAGCPPVINTFEYGGDPGAVESAFWSFGDGGTANGVGPVSHTYQDPGCYDVSLELVTEEGCIGDTIIQNMVCVHDHPQARFEMDPSAPEVFDPRVRFSNTSKGDTAHSWIFPSLDSTVNATNPTIEFPADPERDHEVALAVLSAQGCRDTARRTVTVKGSLTFYAPNAFTPDDDGVNEVFRPRGEGFDRAEYRLTVYDRWGVPVFATEDPEKGWDGTLENGEEAREGVYIWRVVTKNGFSEQKIRKERTFRGHVTLLR